MARRAWPERCAVPRVWKTPAHRAWGRAVTAAARELGVSPCDLARAGFGAHAGDEARARDLAIYLMSVESGFGPTAAAAVLKISKQAVHKAVRRVEDRRDDPATDALLDRAAARMRAA